MILPSFAVVPIRAAAASITASSRRGRGRTLFLAPRAVRMVRGRRSATAGQSEPPASSNVPSPDVLAADLGLPARSPSTRSRSVPARLPLRQSPSPEAAKTAEPPPGPTKAPTPL